MNKTKYDLLKSRLITNLFNPKQYQELYDAIENSKTEKIIVPELGYVSTPLFLSDDLISFLHSKVEKEVGVKIHHSFIHYARYSLSSGNKPMLMPHYDRGLTQFAFSFAVVLEHTIEWDIYVEHQRFIPRKNDAVFFSGSHNVHWRPNIEFGKDDYYDILVCQFMEEPNNDNMVTLEHTESMNKKNGDLCLLWEKLNDPKTYNKKMGYND